jgi:bis(5'-nucleosyl)-tetraphosphatase (symmetrical)
MPTYAIGDIQGCYQSFRKLLKKIQFDPLNDQLWLAGDMLNRGPESLATMQFLLEHQQQVQCVLGNHDLHFLAVAYECGKMNAKDTFGDILASQQKDEIVNWMVKQPLAHFDTSFNTLMVHAGLPFSWSQSDAINYAREVSNKLQSTSCYQFYLSMYGDQPDFWDTKLQGMERLRYITNALTRMRFCRTDGSLELRAKSTPGEQNAHLLPWFELENNHFQGDIIFGHWASLQGKSPSSGIHALDTGCVWGGQLTAFRLEDKKRFAVNSVEI